MQKFQMNNYGGTATPVSTATGLPDNIVKTRDLLYRLIISQLFYDGYQQVAVTLSNMGKICCF